MHLGHTSLANVRKIYLPIYLVRNLSFARQENLCRKLSADSLIYAGQKLQTQCVKFSALVHQFDLLYMLSESWRVSFFNIQ